MSVTTRSTLLAEKHIENACKELPFYVTEFILAKERAGHSPMTLSGYLHDYKRFFDWLRIEGLTDATDNTEIPLTLLAEIKKKDMEFFFDMIRKEKIEKQKEVFVKRSIASTNRFIQSLKSLFGYLTTETEDENGDCYFYRNIMDKIDTLKSDESTARRAKRLNDAILDKDELDGLLSFIRYDYEKTLSPKQLSRFNRDRDRDLAIASLLIGSGIRVSELAGLQLTDVDTLKCDINVIRKGSKADTVSITPTSMDHLTAYLNERDATYKPEPNNQFVFLTRYRGKANPIAVTTIGKLIGRYSQAYLGGKKIKPHLLRHSFAKHWIDEGGSLIGLRDQLGHSSVETTSLYTNFSQSEQRDILNKMDAAKKNEETGDDNE